MNATLAAFLGALVGAGSSVAIIIIQQYFQTKRDRLRIVSKIAIVDYEKDFTLGKTLGSRVAPISAYLISHTMLLEELSKGKIDEEKIKKICEESKKITNAFPGAPEK